MNWSEIISPKVFNPQKLKHQLNFWRFRGDKIVFTNGCFDIVHFGHIDYLMKAADMGDVLLIGLNSDQSVRRLNKGPARPINDEHSRGTVLATMSFINGIIVFEEDTPYELIKIIQPDVLVKGGDWEKEKIVGYDIVTAKGGKVETIPYVQGYSTTLIEKRIIESQQKPVG